VSQVLSASSPREILRLGYKSIPVQEVTQDGNRLIDPTTLDIEATLVKRTIEDHAFHDGMTDDEDKSAGLRVGGINKAYCNDLEISKTLKNLNMGLY